MDKAVFACLACGSCCRNLITKRDGFLVGLQLLPIEKHLFPDNLISPRYALGRGKPETIVTYQLNESTCPYLNSLNQCAIYEKRPLVCQAYPVVLLDQITPDCKCFDGLVWPFLVDTNSLSEQAVASNTYFENLSDNMSNHYAEGSQHWLFDLETKKWKLVSSV